jgi:hypothetical protein
MCQLLREEWEMRSLWLPVVAVKAVAMIMVLVELVVAEMVVLVLRHSVLVVVVEVKVQEVQPVRHGLLVVEQDNLDLLDKVVMEV